MIVKRHCQSNISPPQFLPFFRFSYRLLLLQICHYFQYVYTFASQCMSGSRPTHSLGTFRFSVISLQSDLSLSGQFSTKYSLPGVSSSEKFAKTTTGAWFGAPP